MKVKKTLVSLLLAAVMVLSLAACGGSGGSAGSGGSGGSGGKVRVAFWDNNQLAGLQQIADEWSAESGVEVEFTVMDWSSYWTMLEAGVSGGEMPDVFWMHSAYADKFMGADVLLELDDRIAADSSIDMSNYLEGVTNLYTMNGHYYAMPKDHDTIGVIYNKAIFDKYGVDYPTNDWTWDDYAAIAQEISAKGEADGVYGTYCNTGSNQDTWYNIVYAFGGKIISDDRKSSGYDDPNTLKAMQFIVDEILPGCPSPDSMASTGGDTMFQSGLLGMVTQGSWMVSSFASADNASDYAWAMMPYYDRNGNGQCEKEERCSIYNGLGWSIYAESKVADEAFSLITYLSNEQSQLKQAELGVTMAAYKGCSGPFSTAFGDMDVSALVDVEEEGTLVFRPYSKNAGTWEDKTTQGLVEAWNDHSKIQETMLSLAAEMNDILANE